MFQPKQDPDVFFYPFKSYRIPPLIWPDTLKSASHVSASTHRAKPSIKNTNRDKHRNPLQTQEIWGKEEKKARSATQLMTMTINLSSWHKGWNETLLITWGLWSCTNAGLGHWDGVCSPSWTRGRLVWSTSSSAIIIDPVLAWRYGWPWNAEEKCRSCAEKQGKLIKYLSTSWRKVVLRG